MFEQFPSAHSCEDAHAAPAAFGALQVLVLSQ
jgi:hypothetical protein